MSCHARQACTMVSTSYSQHLAATFSLSSDQCRAAQSNWGWSQGQERIHRKLSSGKKVNVVVVGGSNTCGMNYCKSRGGLVQHSCDSPDALCNNGARGHMGQCSNKSAAWPMLLQATLNACFHNVTVSNVCKRGVGSSYWSSFLLSKGGSQLLASADALVLEVATNDPSASKADPFGLTALTSEERLVRVLLAQRHRPFVLFLNAGAGDYMRSSSSFNLTSPKWTQHTEIGQMHTHMVPMGSDETLSRLMRHYGLPYTSLATALAPFSGTPIKSLDSFWRDGFFFGDSIHASRLGHRMIAAAVAYRLIHLFQSQLDGSSSLWFAGQSRKYTPPSFLTAGAMHQARMAGHYVDLRAHTDAVVDVSGFNLAEDVEGKPGLLAYAPGAYVLISVPAGTHHIHLGAMHSYEHNGRLRATVYSLTHRPDHLATGPTARLQQSKEESSSACVPSMRTSTLASLLGQYPTTHMDQVVDTLWDAHRSVHHVTELVLSNVRRMDCVWLSVRVEASTPERAENKVKLLDLMLFSDL